MSPGNSSTSSSRFRSRRRAAVLSALCAAACLAAGAACGYRLEAAAGSRFASPEVRVDLRPFTNATTVPDAGAVLAGQLREELRRSGFRGGFERVGADYSISGAVRETRSDVASHAKDSRFALEMRLTVVVDIRVVEIGRGRLIWKEEGLTEQVSYYAGTDFQYTESNQKVAFTEATRRVARRIAQTLRVIL